MNMMIGVVEEKNVGNKLIIIYGLKINQFRIKVQRKRIRYNIKQCRISIKIPKYNRNNRRSKNKMQDYSQEKKDPDQSKFIKK